MRTGRTDEYALGAAVPPKIRCRYHPAVLRCDECGCISDELGRSWAAFSGEDPDGVEPTSIAIMCPACAAREFDWRLEAAADYI